MAVSGNFAHVVTVSAARRVYSGSCVPKDPSRTITSLFSRFACRTGHLASRPAAFAAACGIIVVWLISGPIFEWDTTWQLLVNTGTTVVTFLMIFLLQHSQVHDSTAMHLKLDEIIRSVKEAHDDAIDLEKLDEDELRELQKYYYALAARARKSRRPRA